MSFIVAQPPSSGGAGVGDVVGPGSSTDNALARFDGTTGKLLQNSGVILDDANSLTGINSLTVTTLVATTTVTTGDNIIRLNDDVVGAPTEDAGIEVERGAATDATLLWDETNDYWVAGVVGTTSPLVRISGLINSSNISFITLGDQTSPDLTNTGVTAASYGSAANVPSFTVDGKGRLTAAANVAITGSGIDHSLLSNLTTGDPHTQYALTAGDTMTGQLDFASGIGLRFKAAGMSPPAVTLRGNASMTTWTMTLPVDGGTNGYILSTNGSGTTSWIAPAAGTITGSGTAGQIAYFSSGSAIASEASGFTWDATNNYLGIGTDTPASAFNINGTSNTWRMSADSSNYYTWAVNAAGSASFTANTNSSGGGSYTVNTAQGAGISPGDISFNAGARTTSNGGGGVIGFTAGNGFGTGAGGSLTMASGQGGGSTGTGGSVFISSASSFGTGAGGTINVTSGAAGDGGNNSGGTINVTSGAGKGTAAGGLITLLGGQGGDTGVGAGVKLQSGQGGASSGASGDITLEIGSIASGSRGQIKLANTGGNVLIGGGSTASELRIAEPSGSGSEYVAIKAPALAASYTLTLPVDDGTSNQLLKTDGAGVLSWTTSTAGSSTNLLSARTDVANTTSGEDDLMTYTLPANQLGVDGDYLEIHAWGTTDASANSRTFRMYFGGAAVVVGGTAVASSQAWNIRATIQRNGSAAQDIIGNVFGYGAATTQSTQTKDLTATQVIKVTVDGGAASDTTQTGMTIRWYSA